MKKILLYLMVLLISNSIAAQNGTFKCNTQSFDDVNNPSRNAEHHNSMLVTVQIDDITGGFVLISWQGEAQYKWDIIKKLDTRVKAEDKTVYTYYDSRFNVANVQTTVAWIVVLVQDMKNNTFHIAATNEAAGTTNWFHDLTKVAY